jgi:thioredoxin reductase (NADPH)
VSELTVLVYGSAIVLIWLGYLLVRQRRHARNAALQTEALDAGLTEPYTLHPLIDPALCLGCGACANACPEGDVIGLMGTRAELIEPTRCIGHGACSAACPTGAITLVFGTATRGVDLPKVSPDFQSNVPGIFIAGELGGMGLIRNAVEQGRQAMDSIRKLPGIGAEGQFDVIIIGAGPAGLAAALAAKQHGLRSLVIEQDDLGGAVFKYPRGKVVMTQPAYLPIIGKVSFRHTRKEALLEFWRGVVRDHALNIRYRERVDRVESLGDKLVVHTPAGSEMARAVLLAIGRRGTPKRLGVPGEDQEKVVYQLVDAEQYKGRKVLVVGGGDTALEAACSIAEQDGTEVTLSYRGDAFKRAKATIRQRAEKSAAEGRLRILFGSTVRAISQHAVELNLKDKLETVANDFVIVCAGGLLPTEFLKSTGIEIETKYGTA